MFSLGSLADGYIKLIKRIRETFVWRAGLIMCVHPMDILTKLTADIKAEIKVSNNVNK